MTINVQMMNMPYTIKANTTPNKDGTYTIFINSRLTFESQQEGYIHELEHILHGDYDKCNVESIELMAHAYK